MKVISKSPFEDTDSEPEESLSDTESDGVDSDGDVNMKSVAEAYAQGELDTDEDDEDYIESGSSDSEAVHTSDSSMASSVATGENSEVSNVSLSSEEEEEEKEEPMSDKGGDGDNNSPKSRRYKLLFKEFNDEKLNLNLPTTCEITLDAAHELHSFKLNVTPSEGAWMGASFTFQVTVPEGYNEVPPEVKCLGKVFHPCISEDGRVGLSILSFSKHTSDSGWKVESKLMDLVLAINSLFYDPINLECAMNTFASMLYQTNKKEFEKRVKECIQNLPPAALY